ncbi:SMC-Scp complex subunit ScpB [Tahibacter amnicola]|uniref:SMC-Scp complex subunit ScpB n=1 Tax=Tahibacter amnicola TaxID=2976241 RepID=A0ABY6BJE6_9GAMM|nr:SMC-Scp complex subunit ScpB [Tahibacter amnicola]UXI70004.1 SMC-Scp complex subunit ScpB [Tahibacter amnicola]
MDPALLKRVLEAVLLAAGQPLTLAQLAALFGENEPVEHDELVRALEELASDCAERGIELKEVASGYRFQVREDVHQWVARLWTERQTKYSRALLETLALIAYRQPITRAEIEQIRGVAVSSSIIKTLEEREWVRVVGYRDVPGRPALFGTSRSFLDYFNLKSLDELPPLAEIRDLDEFDPQLALAPTAVDAAPAAGEAPPVDSDSVTAPEEPPATGTADDTGIASAVEADGGAPAGDTASEARPAPASPDERPATDDAVFADEPAVLVDPVAEVSEAEPIDDAPEVPEEITDEWVADDATDDDEKNGNSESYQSDDVAWSGDETRHGNDEPDASEDDAPLSPETDPEDTGNDADLSDPTTSDDVPEQTA